MKIKKQSNNIKKGLSQDPVIITKLKAKVVKIKNEEVEFKKTNNPIIIKKV